MSILVFIIYLFAFCLFVAKTGFFTKPGLSKKQLIIAFIFKTGVGIIYGWVGHYFAHYGQMKDTWAFHEAGIIEHDILFSNPKEYFTNLFHNPYPDGLSNFFGSHQSFWNNLKANTFAKILSIFDLFSFKNYYVNVIFYTYLSFFGYVAIYRVFADIFPTKKHLIFCSLFVIPSFVFFTSGIHKDGLVFTGFGLLIYHVYFLLQQPKPSIKRLLGILLGLSILFLLRNNILIIVLPAMLAWVAAYFIKAKPLITFSVVYILSATLFFTAPNITPAFDFPKAVAEKQKSFIKLTGSTSLPVKQLQPRFSSFVSNTPQAISFAILRPYPSDARHILLLAAVIENLLIWLILILFFVFAQIRFAKNSICLCLFCLFFSASLLLEIGFSVNNLGAIVRYRSFALPLTIIPLLLQTDFEKIKKIFKPGA